MATGTKTRGATTAPKRVGMSAEQKAAEKDDPTLRFKRLANKRVNAALRAIRLVGNLSGPAYSKGRTQEASNAIVQALTEGVVAVRDGFNKTKREADSFSL